MKLKYLFTAAALIVASALSQAELKTFEVSNISSHSSNIYPNLDLNNLSQIKIKVDQIEDPNDPLPILDIKKVEFLFPNANNLIAKNFTELTNIPNTYRALVNSPWVFKKVLVELSWTGPADGIHFSYRVIVMDNTSHINNIEQTQGVELFSGTAELINTTPRKVVDVERTRYLDKQLTLRLLHNTNPQRVEIEATWFGHGKKILTLPAPFDARLYPVALILNEQRIKVRFDDAYNGPESSEEDLHTLLEQAFGPLPQ
jgi:hypothetical protein